MARSNVEKLRQFYDQFTSDDHVLILINADPDAISSSMAVKRLLWRRVASSTIAHINVIKRTDNLAMIRLLNVNMVNIREIEKASFNRFVLVDSQPDHNKLFQEFGFNVIIDHHPETYKNRAFADIRPRFGATATIMTEYLRAAKIKPSMKLATSLFYGIKNDTSNFERQALIEDVRAFQFLYRHANIHLVRKIEQEELRFDFFKFFKIAFDSFRRRKGRVFVHLGTVTSPDICVLIADFFLRVNSVNWSIISGVYNKKLIIIFRNDGLRKNAGTVARESFGAFGSAGGHKTMARAEMLLSDLTEITDPKNNDGMLKWIMNQVGKKAGKK